MKAKMKWVLVMVVLLFAASGCEEAYLQMGDPNSGLNVAVDTMEKILPAVGVAGAVFPWGWVVGAITAAVSSIIGIYKNYRKNLIIAEQDENYTNLEQTAAVVVKTIKVIDNIPIDTETGETIGDAVKGRVKEELKDKEIYQIAKAIISGLKTQQ